jgi:hypothetical protein
VRVVVREGLLLDEQYLVLEVNGLDLGRKSMLCSAAYSVRGLLMILSLIESTRDDAIERQARCLLHGWTAAPNVIWFQEDHSDAASEYFLCLAQA